MSGKSASLLTKTQRRRLRSDFEELDEDAKRRDQQLIRERVQTGMHDFRLLTDYPDRQLKLAFEDDADEELRAALADTYLIVERICDLHRYDRDQVLQEARGRAEDVAADTADVDSLSRLDLRTTAEIRQQAEDRFRVSRWEKRMIGLVKLAGAGLLSALFLSIYSFAFRPVNVGNIGVVLGTLLVVTLVLGIVSAVIIAAHALRYDLAPALQTLASQFRKMGQTAQGRWKQQRNRRRRDDHTVWGDKGLTRKNVSGSLTGTADEPPLERLRGRYAAGDLTDEQFERKLERLLDTETLEDAEDRITARE